VAVGVASRSAVCVAQSRAAVKSRSAVAGPFGVVVARCCCRGGCVAWAYAVEWQVDGRPVCPKWQWPLR